MEKVEFCDFAPSGWCENPEESKFLLRLYSIIPCPTSKIKEMFSGKTRMPTSDKIPVWLGGCEMEANKLLRAEWKQPYSNPETGQIVWPNHLSHIDLPLSSYLYLATPHEIDGIASSEVETENRLNRVEALLALYFGRNSVFKVVFSALIDAQKGGQYSVIGEVIANIQPCDGPEMLPENWEYFEETCQRIEVIGDSDTKDRIQRALELFHSGKTCPDTALTEKFVFYWTSIQVLCEGGGTMETNKRLQRIYGFTKNEVEERLLWRGVIRSRNDFYHRGKRISLHKDAERYMQFLFLDLLRDEIGLEPVGASLASIAALDLKIFRNDNA
ncbi:hypothetical protein [Salipiger sp.]|uniref:hypothetical protein n=1 Tax=Salipiger sp. TaxID=2078585 RepID=UPI003A986A39